MTIRTIDRALAVAVILLGVMQSASTSWFVWTTPEPALWFFAGGLLLMTVGALALLRNRYGDIAPGIRWLSIAASVVLAIFWIVLYSILFDKFARQPASFTGLMVIVAGAVVALLQGWRTRGARERRTWNVERRRKE